MKKYLIKEIIQHNSINIIITLLDYETKLSEYFNIIYISSKYDINSNFIIDTAICSGINDYRFINAKLMRSRKLDLSTYRYTDVNDEILYEANLILSKNLVNVNASVLTQTQIDFFINLISR